MVKHLKQLKASNIHIKRTPLSRRYSSSLFGTYSATCNSTSSNGSTTSVLGAFLSIHHLAVLHRRPDDQDESDQDSPPRVNVNLQPFVGYNLWVWKECLIPHHKTECRELGCCSMWSYRETNVFKYVSPCLEPCREKNPFICLFFVYVELTICPNHPRRKVRVEIPTGSLRIPKGWEKYGRTPISVLEITVNRQRLFPPPPPPPGPCYGRQKTV